MQGALWHDRQIDPLKQLQFQDLAKVLSKIETISFERSHGAFIDIKNQRITVSTLWEATDAFTKEAGYKSDLYLRAIGTMHKSNAVLIQNFFEEGLGKFPNQLFTLLEDLRLEGLIQQERPGTKRTFSQRQKYLQKYFQSQLRVNHVRNYPTDALFCMIYLLLTTNQPDPTFREVNQFVKKTLEKIKPFLYETYDAKRTEDILTIVKKIIPIVKGSLPDMTNDYFSFPVITSEHPLTKQKLYEELQRTDDVENEDYAKMSQQEATDERLETWHQEQAPSEKKQTFLQMNLEFGTKTNVRGKSARQTESGDQVFTTAQGTARETKQKDYSAAKSLDTYEDNQKTEERKNYYGKANIHAIPIKKIAKSPNAKEKELYKKFQKQIEREKRTLLMTLEKILEHKQDTIQDNLLFGRLSKKLIPIVTEEFPKLFYKKNEESNTFDATFTLLIDCSASMEYKMEETKRGVTLFHEVLKSLHIPHSIIGFWEEATSTLRKEQRNYFHEIHSFSDSLHKENGPKIMQLQAAEDNRDGFAIRIATDELLKRQEKHKFLLVFTDGEPAANDYYEKGIIDTNIAVNLAQKKGIYTLGLFLSEKPIQSYERKLMESIYGRNHLMIEGLKELPERLSPILRKLLSQTI